MNKLFKDNLKNVFMILSYDKKIIEILKFWIILKINKNFILEFTHLKNYLKVFENNLLN